MRDLKFRAWNGNEIMGPFLLKDIPALLMAQLNHGEDITIEQYTGLKDKNGKEIYEGDILKSFSPSVPSYEVFYCRSSYRLRYKLKNGEYYDLGPLFRMDEILQEGHLKMYPEVIGNIHTNPELLTPADKTAKI